MPVKKGTKPPHLKSLREVVWNEFYDNKVVGNTFGKLLALEELQKTKKGRFFQCKCQCGDLRRVRGVDLRVGRIVECGRCVRTKSSIDRRGLKKGESGLNILYADYRRNAGERGLTWSLSREEVERLFRGACFYCSALPSNHVSTGKKRQLGVELWGDFIYNGIDRIDNTRGYYIGNTVSCCFQCNTAKMDMKASAFDSWIKTVTSKNTPETTLQTSKACQVWRGAEFPIINLGIL